MVRVSAALSTLGEGGGERQQTRRKAALESLRDNPNVARKPDASTSVIEKKVRRGFLEKRNFVKHLGTMAGAV